MRGGLSALLFLCAQGSFAACDLTLPTAPVEVLRYDVSPTGTLRVPPLLTVWSDGRVVVRATSDRAAVTSILLPKGGVAQLLSALQADGMLALEAQAMSELIALTADARPSFVSLTLPHCTRDLTLKASGFMAQAYPDNDDVQSFRAGELRLLNLLAHIQSQ